MGEKITLFPGRSGLGGPPPFQLGAPPFQLRNDRFNRSGEAGIVLVDVSSAKREAVVLLGADVSSATDGRPTGWLLLGLGVNISWNHRVGTQLAMEVHHAARYVCLNPVRPPLLPLRPHGGGGEEGGQG